MSVQPGSFSMIPNRTRSWYCNCRYCVSIRIVFYLYDIQPKRVPYSRNSHTTPTPYDPYFYKPLGDLNTKSKC